MAFFFCPFFYFLKDWCGGMDREWAKGWERKEGAVAFELIMVVVVVVVCYIAYERERGEI